MSFLGAQNSIALGVQGLIHIDTGVVGSAGYLLAKSLHFGGASSAYLSRTLTTPTSSTIYTWSGWVKRGALSATGYLFGASTTTNFGFNSSNQLLLTLSGTAAVTTTAVYRDPAAWYHLVYVQNGATQTIYVNGVSAGTGTTANTVFNTAIAHQLAAANTTNYYDGEMAEVNFVDGQALLPASFGATGANSQWLPKAYTGTYGTNGFYLPFNPTLSTSYAGLFDGSTQWLSMPLNAGLTLAAADFTIEAWVYKNATGTAEIFGNTGSINYGIDCQASNYPTISLSSNGTTTTIITGSTALSINTWYHIAFVRSSTTIKIYVNGILDVTGTFSGAIFSGSNVDVSGIGARPGGGAPDSWFNGYISNFRVVKGTAVYTANFIPPTAALTAITNTSLLTLQSATIVDNSGNSVAIANNGTVVTSVQSPFLNTTVLTTDSSGNANNWTPNNISLTAGSTYDSLTDVPTLTSKDAANYAVFNPLDFVGVAPFSGNLILFNVATNAQVSARATVGVSSGKWYWEQTLVSLTSNLSTLAQISGGVCLSTYSLSGGPGSAGMWGFQNTNATATFSWKFDNGTGTNTFTRFNQGDIASFALDMGAGTLDVYRNNVLLFTCSTSLTGTVFPVAWAYAATSNQALPSINFGQQPFVYTAPTGFLALNTFNIAAGTVTTSGTFTGNASTNGPMVWLNGTPTAMTINGNAVTFGTHADKLANGFKVRSSSASYNASGSNTYVATTVGEVFKYEDAQSNP